MNLTKNKYAIICCINLFLLSQYIDCHIWYTTQKGGVCGMNKRQQEKTPRISNNSFNVINTKSDPSQHGSPIPFQRGDFASVDRHYERRQTFAETLSFYVIGIVWTVFGFYSLVTFPIFQSILDQTILSFVIAFAFMIVNFIAAHFLTSGCTKIYRKRKRGLYK